MSALVMFLLSFWLSVFGLRVSNVNVSRSVLHWLELNDFVCNPIEMLFSRRFSLCSMVIYRIVFEYSAQKIYSFFFLSSVVFHSLFFSPRYFNNGEKENAIENKRCALYLESQCCKGKTTEKKENKRREIDVRFY